MGMKGDLRRAAIHDEGDEPDGDPLDEIRELLLDASEILVENGQRPILITCPDDLDDAIDYLEDNGGLDLGQIVVLLAALSDTVASRLEVARSVLERILADEIAEEEARRLDRGSAPEIPY